MTIFKLDADVINNRITKLEDKYEEKQLFQDISGIPAGTVPTYTGVKIVQDKSAFEGAFATNALAFETSGGRPTQETLLTAADEIVRVVIDLSGNYALTGTPTAANYGILWRTRGTQKAYADAAIPEDSIVDGYDLESSFIRNGTTIKPIYDADNLDMGSGDVKGSTLSLNTSYTETGSEAVGTTFYDAESLSYTTILPNGVKYQHGQELIPTFKNQTGSDISDGVPVMFAGGVGVSGRIKIQPAIADGSISPSYTIGVTTQTILNGADGKVATFGAVRGIKTNYTGIGIWGTTWVAGQEIFVSPTDAGVLTNVRPEAPICAISMGVIQVVHANLGQIAVRPYIPVSLVDLCDVNGTPLDTTGQFPVWDKTRKVFDFNYNFLQSFDDTKEPTGFKNPGDVIITGDSTTRTVTLTGSGWKASYKNVDNTTIVTGWTSPAHDNTTTKVFFLTYNGTDIAWRDITTLDDLTFYQDLLIAWTFYDNSNSTWVYQRESHGYMQWQVHRSDHLNKGAYKGSGGGLSNYTLSSTTAADRRPDVEATLIYDEDLPTINAALSTSLYTQYFLSGAAGTGNFAVNQSDMVPLSTNQPYFNEFTGGSWQQTLMSNNYYMSLWQVAVPTAADSTSQNYRFSFIQGQQQSSTLLAEQSINPGDISLGQFTDLTPEIAFLNHIIIKYQGGNWTIEAVRVLSGSRYSLTSSPAGNYLTSVNTDATLTGLGTTTSPLGIDLANANTWSAAQTFSAVTPFVLGIQADSITEYTPTAGTAFNGSLFNTGGLVTANRYYANFSVVANNELVRKDYVDSLIQNVKRKDNCLVATTANITLSGEQTIDGVLTSSNRVLVWQQTDQTENGIYVTDAGAWTRATDADIGDEILGSLVKVLQGTLYADRQFNNSNSSSPTIGSTNITFVNLGNGVIHNDLIDLQGGTTDEYYHLTSQQHTNVTSLTTAEYSQLANIGATTISATQWGYLGATDQALATTNTVEFTKMGVGTSTINHTLVVNGDGTENTGLVVEGATTYGFAFDNISAATDYLKIRSIGVGTTTTNVDNILVLLRTGMVGIGTAAPAAQLEVAGGIKVGNDAAAAGSTKVGTTRYRVSGNNSYFDICMQDGASSYVWENIATKSW